MKIFISIACICLHFALFAQQTVVCHGTAYELVDPFLGDWKEYTVTAEEEIFIGTLEMSKSPDGCTISQRFVSADGSFSYQSSGYVEPSSGMWREIYVFSNGNKSEYQWFRQGNDVIMRRTGGTRKLDYLHQLRLTNVSEDSYEVIEEHSFDSGLSWEDKELTRVKKQK